MNKDKDKEVYCGECLLFMYEDINGLGHCAAQKGWMHCADLCEFWTDPMGNEEVLRILHYARNGGEALIQRCSRRHCLA